MFAVVAVALPLSVYAADKKSDSGKASKNDRNFIMEAANDGLAEVELGKVAQQKSSNEDVKKFGQRMIDDHTKANQELEPIATKMGVTPPSAPEGKHAKLVQNLSKKDKSFDKDYIDAMVKDHETAVKLFDKQSKKGDSEELRQLAAKTLPTLKEHLAMARDMKKSMKK
jgi:putative membrane protein